MNNKINSYLIKQLLCLANSVILCLVFQASCNRLEHISSNGRENLHNFDQNGFAFTCVNSSGKCQSSHVSPSLPSLVHLWYFSLCWQATVWPRTPRRPVEITLLPVLFRLASMTAASVRSALCSRRSEHQLWSAVPGNSSVGVICKVWGTWRQSETLWRFSKQKCALNTVLGPHPLSEIPRAVSQR